MKRINGLSTATALVLGALVAACGGGDSGSSDAASTPAAEPTTTSTPAAAPAAEPQTVDVDPAILPEGVTVAMVQEGQEIFGGAGICYTCHTADASGGPLAPDLTDETWLNIDGEYQSIIELVNTGVPQPLEHPGAMLPKAGMPLTDAQVASVAAYVYTLNK